MSRNALAAVFSALMLVPGFAAAVDYVSVAEPAILYDAPSAGAQKLFVLSRDYPLEVVVRIEGWSRVRDETGMFAWAENRLLSDRRMVMVRTVSAEARRAPDDTAPIAFNAEKSVVMELIETSGAWVKVRHADGSVGFIKVSQLWGV
jgi:SH3-like domain-containing protein